MKTHIEKAHLAEQSKYNQYLSQQKVRMSRARREVLQEVLATHGHFTAENLAKICNAKKKVSRATVYRILKELLESRVIRETAFGDKHRHFEHIYDEKPHHHAQCVRCHEFIEFPDLNEDSVYRPILEKKGFKILGHEMHFYGVCRKCQTPAEKEK